MSLWNSNRSKGSAAHLRLVERRLRILVSLLIGIIVAFVLFLVPLPYFIYMPGSAEPVKPMVKVEGGGTDEKGTLMLTTVRAQNARLATYLVALVHPYEEVAPKQSAFQPGESQSEYIQRQAYVMLSSQSNAMQAAYRKANIPFRISADGVMVLRFIAGMPAENVLVSGDIIVEADGKAIADTAGLQEALQHVKAGDKVKLTVIRDGDKVPVELQTGELQDQAAGGEKRIGIGIQNPANVQSVKAENPAQQVHIAAGEIGGPSAGLMFALEIFNQLVPSDITKGYRIAGTGTIDAEGNVGAIGGIVHKIVAADRERADIFFAPKDYDTPQGYRYTNFSDAKGRAEQIGSKMKIVPVGSIDDALAYLDSLPAK